MYIQRMDILCYCFIFLAYLKKKFSIYSKNFILILDKIFPLAIDLR